MEDTISKEIIEAKRKGVTDKEIGEKYGVNLKFIEKVITKETGINISSPLLLKKRINKLKPKDFQIECNSVWSFKSRGNWATHNGQYRGNWSPYIPRNIISKYSKEEDTVLDFFCGAGTTAIESKLLNRNFIGFDINPNAIELANENINFNDLEQNKLFSPEIKLEVGDARKLSQIENSSIDLICAHPPYSNIINYTHNNDSDLSNYNVEEFLIEMEKVARESFRVLKDNHYCAILIGDMRKNKNVIPLGFWTIEKFLSSGFKIKELIIKRQHNCKTTGFWYKNSIKYNFLLLAHEYLVVFEKTKDILNTKLIRKFDNNVKFENLNLDKGIELESKTVWIFNNENWIKNTISNLIGRYSNNGYCIYKEKEKIKDNIDILITFFSNDFYKNLKTMLNRINTEGIFVVICEDYREDNNLLYSQAIEIEEKLRDIKDIKIKEIVIISIENGKCANTNDNLEITHKYLLIYKKS